MEELEMCSRKLSPVLALALMFCGSAEAAEPVGSDWPCIQHKVDKLTSVQMWDGPPVEDLREWREDENIM